MTKQWFSYERLGGRNDPCPSSGSVFFVVPPNQWLVTQSRGLKQFSPRQALQYGVLWPDLWSAYPRKAGEE
ncbi:MAG: hypothetical protein OWQ59_06370 [Alicyclobacillaceae bacterium]|jgi:spore coat protein JA|uniref:hypothetical protein n=1 Tax=Alicyclobacillus sp. SP_1 TaxID=2942475 RepID=UPI002157A38C|nr:hypothetical protein [Alicyclobacillus sp. SP_1]MCY0888069.1 hypothetical protein [Alicyclobacillaceae bacterium]MCY0895646.1 hypothetical protein [Alicyclobacillaceae bacterium]